MSADGLTVQTDGNGAGQYVDAERGLTIQRNTDGSGQYVDEQKGITLQVNSDGTGQYPMMDRALRSRLAKAVMESSRTRRRTLP